jgi:glycosyltransferase involved in cell wall biosynthesis
MLDVTHSELPVSAGGRVPSNWLILSHAFNMDGRAASQTITDKIPYLLDHGVRPHVLSAIAGTQDHRFAHDRILAWGPAALRFDLRHSLARHIGRGIIYRVLTTLMTILLAPFIVAERLIFGFSGQWSWSLPATWRGLRLARKESIGILYSTGGAWSAHFAAWMIKKRTGIAWIAEIHDPLVDNTLPLASRELKMRAWLERKICADADLVWWFTEQALQSARARNPGLGDRGFAVLAGAPDPQVDIDHSYGDMLTLSYFGALSSSRSLLPFLEALGDFTAAHPQARASLRVCVYGSQLDRESALAVRSLGLDDIVIGKGRIEADAATGLSGRERILREMRRSDVLLLLHGMEPSPGEYIPSKLYEYLWAKRPVFALTQGNPRLDEIVREHGGYVSPVLDRKDIARTIGTIWQAWKARALPESEAPPIGIDAATATILRRVERLACPPSLAGRRACGAAAEAPASDP